MIELNNVSKKFKDIEVLKNINVQLDEGNIYGLYGRNGSGKTLLLKIICGFYLPTSGEVLFDGVNHNALNEFPDSLRALIENPSFFPDLTGYENLKLLAKIQNRICDDEIFSALKIVNLYEEKDKKYSKYSLGMKQKLGIAQVIMEDPKIIILDEPFNGIEEDTVKKLIDYLRGQSEKGKLIIVSTHIKDDLNKLTDKVFYIDGGEIKK